MPLLSLYQPDRYFLTIDNGYFSKNITPVYREFMTLKIISDM